jgi:hypothetical protein
VRVRKSGGGSGKIDFKYLGKDIMLYPLLQLDWIYVAVVMTFSVQLTALVTYLPSNRHNTDSITLCLSKFKQFLFFTLSRSDK